MPSPAVLAANSAVLESNRAAEHAAALVEEAQLLANSSADRVTEMHMRAPLLPEAPPQVEIKQDAMPIKPVAKQNSILFEAALLGETVTTPKVVKRVVQHLHAKNLFPSISFLPSL